MKDQHLDNDDDVSNQEEPTSHGEDSKPPPLSLRIRQEALPAAEKLADPRPDLSILGTLDRPTSTPSQPRAPGVSGSLGGSVRIDIADSGSIPIGGPSLASGQDGETLLFEGEAQLNEHIKQGYDIVLIAGVYATGKSQFIDAFEEHVQPPVLDPFTEDEREDGIVKRTTPNTIKVYPIEGGLAGHARKILLVDAAGEIVAGLYPYRGKNKRNKIIKEDLRLPDLVKDRLRGLILMIDLKAYWKLNTDSEDKKNQIQILTWILALFRWLINDGAFPENTTLPLQDYIVARVREMKPKLNIPVLVLFSKADELHSFEIPERQGINSRHVLYPRLETPFFLAYNLLRRLHEALFEHANYFRYDFAHSIVTDERGIKSDDAPPCGVELSLKWLLNHRGRWPRLPTQHWIRIQRTIDFILRQDRWERLPEPKIDGMLNNP